MAHHLAGTSNSAKRRQAEAEELRDTPTGHDGMISSITKTGTDVLSQMQSRFGDLCSMGKEKAVQAEHAVEETIQQRPIVSVLAAMGLGALLGSVFTMFCHRQRN